MTENDTSTDINRFVVVSYRCVRVEKYELRIRRNDGRDIYLIPLLRNRRFNLQFHRTKRQNIMHTSSPAAASLRNVLARNDHRINGL